MSAKKQTNKAKPSGQPDTVIPPTEDQELQALIAGMDNPPATTRKSPVCPKCNGKIGGRTITCPHCGWVKPKPEGGSEPKPKRAKGGDDTTTTEATKSDLIKLLSALRGKGFDFKVSIDPLEENPTPTISGNDKVKGFVELINFDPKATTGVRIYDSKLKFEFLADLDTLLTIAGLPVKNP